MPIARQLEGLLTGSGRPSQRDTPKWLQVRLERLPLLPLLLYSKLISFHIREQLDQHLAFGRMSPSAVRWCFLVFASQLPNGAEMNKQTLEENYRWRGEGETARAERGGSLRNEEGGQVEERNQQMFVERKGD